MPLAPDLGHDLDAMAAAVDERTRLVIVCNPNNPTGVYRSADEIERFVDALPEDLAILVDEAYFDFVDRPDAGRTMSLARERPNLLVTRTFSKAHGLCGLRVGYGVGGSGWVDGHRQGAPALQHERPRPGRRAREPAPPARRSTRRVRAVVDGACPRGRRRLRIRAWAFTASQANFILVRPDSDPAAGSPGAHEQLLRLGVIVRDGAALGCPGRLRVSIGTPDENDAFLSARAQLAAPAPRESRPGRTTP